MRPLSYGLILLAFAATARGQDPQAEQVVQKAIQAHGGAAALERIQAGVTRAEGMLTVGKAATPVALRESFHLPDRFRLEVTTESMAGKVEYVQVVNGERLRHAFDGQEIPVAPEQRREAEQSLAVQQMLLIAPLLNKDVYKLKLLPDEEDIRGRKAAAVLVQGKGLPDVTLFFAKASGLLAGLERKGVGPTLQKATLRMEFTDFAEVQGVKLASAWEVTADGEPFLSCRVTERRLLDGLPPQVFKLGDAEEE